MLPSSPPVDLLILGGGPTGLYAAYYAGARELSVRIIDSAPMLGGQLSALYPEKSIYDVPGFPAVTADELVSRLTKQGTQYGAGLSLDQQATALQPCPTGWRINTDRQVHEGRAVLICGGMGAIRPKPLRASVIQRFEGNGLAYHLPQSGDCQDQTVVIVGGQHQAVDWARRLVGTAKHLTLVHRRNHFRANEADVRHLRAKGVVIRTPYELAGVNGSGTVDSITIRHTESGETEVIPASRLLINAGYVSTLGPLATWGLTLQGNAVKVNERMQTNLPGVFAAGDICTYPGKLKLLATAFGEAAMAVNYAYCHLNPSANPFPGHSTNLAPPPGLSAD